MPDAVTPADIPHAPFRSLEGLVEAWAAFRAGNPVPCPGDGAPLALAVDGAAGVYRFVCVRCGAASQWFDSGANGLRIRGPTQPAPLQGGGED